MGKDGELGDCRDYLLGNKKYFSLDKIVANLLTKCLRSISKAG